MYRPTKFIFLFLLLFSYFNSTAQKFEYERNLDEEILTLKFKVTPFIPGNFQEKYRLNITYEDIFDINFDEDLDDIENNSFMNQVDVFSSRAENMPFTGEIDGFEVLFSAGREHTISFDLTKFSGLSAAELDYNFNFSVDPVEIPMMIDVKSKQKPGKNININVKGPTVNTNYSISLINPSGDVIFSDDNLRKNESTGSFSLNIPTEKNYKSKSPYAIYIVKNGFGKEEIRKEIMIKSSLPIVPIIAILAGGIVYLVTQGGSDSKGNPPLPGPPSPPTN